MKDRKNNFNLKKMSMNKDKMKLRRCRRGRRRGKKKIDETKEGYERG